MGSDHIVCSLISFGVDMQRLTDANNKFNFSLSEEFSKNLGFIDDYFSDFAKDFNTFLFIAIRFDNVYNESFRNIRLPSLFTLNQFLSVAEPYPPFMNRMTERLTGVIKFLKDSEFGSNREILNIITTIQNQLDDLNTIQAEVGSIVTRLKSIAQNIPLRPTMTPSAQQVTDIITLQRSFAQKVDNFQSIAKDVARGNLKTNTLDAFRSASGGNEVRTENFYVSAFGKTNYPVDVEEINDKLLFHSKEKTLAFSKTEKPEILSNPIKLLYSDRQLNLSYGGAQYTGGKLEYYSWKEGEDYYKRYLNQVADGEETFEFNAKDALSFELRDSKGDPVKIKHLNLYPIFQSPRIIISSDSGIYFGDIPRLISQGIGFFKVTDFVVGNVKPFIAQNTFFFVDEEDSVVYQAYLDNSNNTRFVFGEACNQSNGVFPKIKSLGKLSETKALIIFDDNTWGQLNIYPKALLGYGRGEVVKRTDKKFLGTDIYIEEIVGSLEKQNKNRFLYLPKNEDEEYSVVQFSDEYTEDITLETEEFYGRARLNPFTISNYFPANGLYLNRTLKEIFVFKKGADGLQIGLEQRDIQSIRDYVRREIHRQGEEEGRMVSDNIKQTLYGAGKRFQGSDCFCIYQNKTDKGKVYGLSFSGSFTEYQ